jgi:hypothetical protein
MTLTTATTAGQVFAGQTVVMPSGDLLPVARTEYVRGTDEVALFMACGERYLLDTDCEVGIVDDEILTGFGA